MAKRLASPNCLQDGLGLNPSEATKCWNVL